jgi:hypothetical protein
MQELESPLQLTADTELVAEVQKEYTLKARMKKVRGLTLFAVNVIDNFCTKVKITSTPVIGIDKKVHVSHKAVFDQKSIYVWALNEGNARRKVAASIIRLIQQKEQQQNGTNRNFSR